MHSASDFFDHAGWPLIIGMCSMIIFLQNDISGNDSRMRPIRHAHALHVTPEKFLKRVETPSLIGKTLLMRGTVARSKK